MSEAYSHIVCGHCGQTNRVPANKPALESRCGSCHRPLFSGHPIEVDEAAFDRQIERSGIPLLIDVWAPWCGPCRSMAPMLERAALELEPRVRLLKLNADQAPQLAARLGVRGIPALLLMHSRRILARTSGAMNTARIVEWTNSNLCAAGIDCR
jgi:thioredoxin 2